MTHLRSILSQRLSELPLHSALLAGCLLWVVALVPHVAVAQMVPTADRDALTFSESTGPLTVKITPSKTAKYDLAIVGQKTSDFKIETNDDLCTGSGFVAGTCHLVPGAGAITLTIDFTPSGGTSSASIYAKPADGGVKTKLVELSGSGDKSIPTADSTTLAFDESTSGTQKVKITPAKEAYSFKLTGTDMAAFTVKSDDPACTNAKLRGAGCQLPAASSGARSLSMTVSFKSTGAEAEASIEATPAAPGGATVALVALTGKGEKDQPAVDTSALDFHAGSDEQTLKITPGTTAVTLGLTPKGSEKFFRITSDDSSCSGAALVALTCRIPAAGKNIKPVTLTVRYKPNGGETNASIELIGGTGAAPPLVVLTGRGLKQNGEFDCAKQYSDCDLAAGIGFSIIGGIEQSYLSSEENETSAFIRAFTQIMNPLRKTGPFSQWGFGPWAIIRDLGAPQSGANQNIVSAIMNPSGAITTSSLSSIGYSLDFLIGLATDRRVVHSQQYSWGVIAAVGATTPLSSTIASAGYVVPKLGTQECAELQARFASPTAYQQGYSNLLVKGSTTCLANSILPSNSPVTTLAFSGENRSNFLEKWEAGARTTFRSYAKSGQGTCDLENPCQRGIVDFTVGQDAAVTRGTIRHFLVKVDGVQPLPYSKGILYLFGTAAIRLERNTSLPPLILDPATSVTLKMIPNASIFVEPFRQPDKDFYRVGVGLSLSDIFTALKPKQ